MQTDKKNDVIGTHAAEELSPGGRRPEGDSSSASSPPRQPSDTQVDSHKTAPRRKFSIEYKLKILEAYEACDNAMARGALLRKEGLYHSRLTAWRQQRDAGRLTPNKRSKSSKRVQQLSRQNAALKKKLAQAEAIIELQKKVSEILGTHILPPEGDE